jgi:hypothetical protein
MRPMTELCSSPIHFFFLAITIYPAHFESMIVPPVRLIAIVSVLALACASPARAWDWVLQCVPFARALSNISLYGDAWRWWSEAAGRYDRGHIPRAGSVLSFEPNLRRLQAYIDLVITLGIGSRHDRRGIRGRHQGTPVS